MTRYINTLDTFKRITKEPIIQVMFEYFVANNDRTPWNMNDTFKWTIMLFNSNKETIKFTRESLMFEFSNNYSDKLLYFHDKLVEICRYVENKKEKMELYLNKNN